MQQVVLLGAVLYSLVILGLLTLNGALLALAIPFALYLSAALLYQPAQVRLRVTRTLSADRVAPGQPVEVVLQVVNDGRYLEQVMIRDLYPTALALTAGAPTLLTSLAPNAEVVLCYTLSGTRGLHQFGGVEVTAAEQLGIVTRQSVIPASDQIFVMPDLIRLRHVELRPRRTGVYAGLIPVRQGGPGVEFFGLRPYQPGDPERWINARASARSVDQMYVNQYEQERVADIGLILDGRRRADVRTQDGSLFEHGVSAAAALADVLLRSGNRVGLAVYSHAVDWTFPGYGTVQRERILRALARARTSDRAVFEGLELLPTRLFPPRSQIILISTLLPEDLTVLTRLRGMGHPLLVISPNPIDWERAALPAGQATELAARIAGVERALLLQRLRRIGVEVVDWHVTTPFYEIAARALSGRRPY